MPTTNKSLQKQPLRISVVVTCYNEEENIKELYERVIIVFKELKHHTFELIYVDNVSTDKSRIIFEQLAKKDSRVKVIVMSRNTGTPQTSFSAGMSYATGDAIFLLHGDIQDPPELI